MTYLSVAFDLINLVQGFEIRAGKGCDVTSGTLGCFDTKNFPCSVLCERSEVGVIKKDSAQS